MRGMDMLVYWLAAVDGAADSKIEIRRPHHHVYTIYSSEVNIFRSCLCQFFVQVYNRAVIQ